MNKHRCANIDVLVESNVTMTMKQKRDKPDNKHMCLMSSVYVCVKPTLMVKSESYCEIIEHSNWNNPK
jgi:hypothetical protein